MNVDPIVAPLLLAGSALSMLAGIGLHRFRSLYSRMHAATKPATLGLLLVLIATGVALGDGGAAVKLALVGILQFATAPVAGHLIARAAHRTGEPLGERFVVDELRRDRGEDDDAEAD